MSFLKSLLFCFMLTGGLALFGVSLYVLGHILGGTWPVI